MTVFRQVVDGERLRVDTKQVLDALGQAGTIGVGRSQVFALCEQVDMLSGVYQLSVQTLAGVAKHLDLTPEALAEDSSVVLNGRNALKRQLDEANAKAERDRLELDRARAKLKAVRGLAEAAMADFDEETTGITSWDNLINGCMEIKP